MKNTGFIASVKVIIHCLLYILSKNHGFCTSYNIKYFDGYHYSCRCGYLDYRGLK